MKVKLDENLGARRIVESFRASGHDAATVVEQGMQAAADELLVDACRDEGRCLVTLDLGFADTLRFPPSRSAGLVVLRVPSRTTLEDLVRAVETLGVALATRAVYGKLWILQGGRIREHQEA